MGSSRINQTTDRLAAEGVIKTGLITGDAGVNLRFTAFKGFIDKLCVCQHWPCHRHYITVAIGQHLLGYIGHIDAITGDSGNTQFPTQSAGDTGKSRSRHHGGDSGHCGLVPSEVGTDNGCARSLHFFAELNYLLP